MLKVISIMFSACFEYISFLPILPGNLDCPLCTVSEPERSLSLKNIIFKAHICMYLHTLA